MRYKAMGNRRDDKLALESTPRRDGNEQDTNVGVNIVGEGRKWIGG